SKREYDQPDATLMTPTHGGIRTPVCHESTPGMTRGWYGWSGDPLELVPSRRARAAIATRLVQRPHNGSVARTKIRDTPVQSDGSGEHFGKFEICKPDP